MTTIHLKEFIKTGKFGPISIGSTKADVVNAFGKKFDFGNGASSQIIKYGWYEFFYWTETELIFGIQNDHLQADCSNHKEMIEFKSKLCTFDKWFLQTFKNIKFKEIEELLIKENISYKIVPEYKGSDENLIKCLDSKVTFDFASEYRNVEFRKNGEFQSIKEIIETEQSNFVLNGIRLFDFKTTSANNGH